MSKRGQQTRFARLVRDQIAGEDRRRRTMWISIIAVAALGISGLVGWGIYASQKSGGYNVPKHAVDGASGVLVGGSKGVQVDVYLDFLCPYCKVFEDEAGPTLKQLATDKKIKLVYHPVAFLDPASTNRYSTRSSASFGCAADGDKQAEYADALFARQPAEGGPGLSDDDLIQVGGSVGLLNPSFARCVRDGHYLSWTRHVTDAASAARVTGTPTVRVNGTRVEPNAAAVSAAVRAAKP